MSGHTPGPWEVCNSGVGKRAKNLFIWQRPSERGEAFGGHGIAEVFEEGASIYGADVLANARLIAAAPETTEALADLVEQLEGIGIPDWAGAEGLDLTKAKAAIAKAKP
jgi:hypothetical protein